MHFHINSDGADNRLKGIPFSHSMLESGWKVSALQVCTVLITCGSDSLHFFLFCGWHYATLISDL